MRLSPRPHEESEGDDNPLADATWLYSFADLMTQLLLFAILMVTVVGLAENIPAAEARPDALERTERELDQFVEQANLGGVMAVDRGADRLVIRMKSVLLFKEGQASLTAEAEKVLAGVVRLLANVPNAVRVEGHTDDVPIRSANFPSNWELSSARAISVARYFEDHGLAKHRLAVAGYGEFHPIIANDTAEHRSLNRRVELVVVGEGTAKP